MKKRIIILASALVVALGLCFLGDLASKIDSNGLSIACYLFAGVSGVIGVFGSLIDYMQECS